jgi:predicted phosphoribosyltransferase
MFKDRSDAGKQLAAHLLDWRDRDAVVVALPRGGLPIGAEIATAIGAPLDLTLVRKIGLPFQRELAIAAVVDGDQPEMVLNEEVIGQIALPEGYLDGARAEALAEIERRREVYFGDRKRPDLAGRPVIVADDGIATGSTARAAIHALRRKQPSRLILAVPVAPADTVAALRHEVDELICLETPDPFYAISLAYNEFPQLSDQQVIAILAATLEANKSARKTLKTKQSGHAE